MSGVFGNNHVDVESLNIFSKNNNDNDHILYTKNNCYDQDILYVIQFIYILAGILWIYIIYLLDLYQYLNWITIILLFIPLIVFGVSYYNACQLNTETEVSMLQSNYLSFGFLITVILLNWNSPIKGPNKTKFFKLLIVAFIFIMLSMIDVWTTRQKQPIVIHSKSILQTSALILLSISLYSYYKAHERAKKRFSLEKRLKVK